MSKDISDTIVAMILDKLITKVCRDEIVKEINSHFNDHCNNFISKLLSPYLKTPFLFHENGLDTQENNSSNIFYNLVLTQKLNTWVSFKEPNSSQIDRYASNKAKLSRKFDAKNPILKRQSVENNIVIEQKEFEKEKSDKTKKKVKIKLKDIWKKSNNKLSSKDIKKNVSLNKLENKETKVLVEKREKELILEIPGTFIPYEKNENINILINNTEENNLLRKERELKNIEKEEMLKNEKNKKLKKINNNSILSKKFNYDKLTFDSDGNIIKIHLPQVDSFKNDFIISNPKIKDEINKLILEKNDTYNKKKSTIISNKKSLKLIDSKLKIKERISETNTNDDKIIKIEYNPEDKMDEFFLKSSKKKKISPQIIYSGSNFEKISPEIGVIISDTDKNQKIEDKEKAKNNMKIGGFDYIKKYNRPSMNEISNLLSSQKSKINNNYITSFFNYDYSKNLNDNKNEINEKYYSELNKLNKENNYIGYKEEFTDNNNPLFQGAVYIKDEVQNNQNNKKNGKENSNKVLSLKIKNKKSFSNENIFLPKRKINSKLKKNVSYQINPLYNKKNIHLNINSNLNNNYLSSVNNILLSDNFNGPNLKSVFLDENQNHIITHENKAENNIILKLNSIENENKNTIAPLKNLKYRKDILPTITENNNKEKYIIQQKYINKFNFDIVKNKNWGNNINDDNLFNKNSYKDKFLKERNKLLKIHSDIKVMNNKEIKIEKFKQRNNSYLLKKNLAIKINNN